jgi:hypothetical protein
MAGVREKGLPPGTAAETPTFSPGTCVVPHTSPDAGNGGRVQRGEFADVHGHRTGHGNGPYRLPRGSHLTWHGSVPRPILAATAERSGDVQDQTTGRNGSRERGGVSMILLIFPGLGLGQRGITPHQLRPGVHYRSPGLRILSHRGRGGIAAPSAPQARPASAAPLPLPLWERIASPTEPKAKSWARLVRGEFVARVGEAFEPNRSPVFYQAPRLGAHVCT